MRNFIYDIIFLLSMILVMVLLERFNPQWVPERFLGLLAESKTKSAESCLSPRFQSNLTQKMRFRSLLRQTFSFGKDTLLSDMFIQNLARTTKMQIVSSSINGSEGDVMIELHLPTYQMIASIIQRYPLLRDIYFEASNIAFRNDSSTASDKMRTFVYAAALDSLRNLEYISWIQFYQKKTIRLHLDYGFFRWRISSFELISWLPNQRLKLTG